MLTIRQIQDETLEIYGIFLIFVWKTGGLVFTRSINHTQTKI